MFVVSGRAGDFRCAEILLESPCMRRDPPTRGAKGEGVAADVAGSVGGGSGARGWCNDTDRSTFVPVDLRNGTEGVDVATTIQGSRLAPNALPHVAYQCHGTNVGPMGACRKGDGGVTSGVPFVAFDRAQVTSKANRSNPKPGDPCHTIHEGQPPAVAVSLRGREGGATAEVGGDVSASVRASKGGGDKPHILSGMAVRRLTPREVERCFGMPDDWTLITVRGKPAADGPRYKACGNSWCIPPVRWIGERLNKAVRP